MNTNLLEICLKDLFEDREKLDIRYKPDTVEAVLRLRDMYLWIVKNPSAKDNEFVKEDVKRYKVSRPTGYADLNIIKALLPDLSRTSKDFNRWRFTEMILETYNIAKFKKDVRTMERAAASFAKFTGIDKEAEEKFPLDKIIPPPLIPTDDPSVLGFEPIPNRRQRIRELIQKYSGEMPEIVEIDAEPAEIDLYPHDQNNLNSEL